MTEKNDIEVGSFIHNTIIIVSEYRVYELF